MLLQIALPIAAVLLKGCSASADSLRELASRAGAAALVLGLAVTGFYWVLSMRDSKMLGERLGDEPSGRWTDTDLDRAGIERPLRCLAQLFSFVPALLIFMAVPFGDRFCFSIHKADAFLFSELMRGTKVCTAGAIFEPNLLVLYAAIIAIAGLPAIVMSGTPHQRVSWESRVSDGAKRSIIRVVEAIALLGPLAIYSTVDLRTAVHWQVLHTWGVFVQPLAFVLFWIAAMHVPGLEGEPNKGLRLEIAGHVLFRQRFSELTSASLGLIALITKVIVVIWLQDKVRSHGNVLRRIEWLARHARWLVIAALGNVVVTKGILAIAGNGSEAVINALQLFYQLTMVAVALLSLIGVAHLAHVLTLPTTSVGTRAITSDEAAMPLHGGFRAEQ